jgi:peptide/nickel transport system substrate-binding protein
MGVKLPDFKLVLAITLALSLLAVLACGAADDEEKPAGAAAPAAEATKVPAAAKEEPKAVVKVVPTAAPPAQVAEIKKEAVKPSFGDKAAAMKEAEVGYKYIAEPELAGIYWDYRYTGPRPTEFSENPRFTELVKQGKLPKLEDRLPAEVKVVQPPGGIGVYGGTKRLTHTGGASHWAARHYWDKKNSDEVTHMPHIGFFEVSDDGRVFTFRLRKGAKFSDGTTMTMEDVRFAWEDVNLNSEMHATYDPQFLDSVTKNVLKFAVLDDDHFTLTWETPNFILMEGEVRAGATCSPSSFCFYTPSHYAKQFHPKYADAADLKKMLDEQELEDWTRLMTNNLNWSKNAMMPYMGHYYVATESDNFWTLEANPYFFEVDPEGNQLPYMDGMQIIRVESRDVAVFRSMAGETDLSGRDFQIFELPLYRSNMEKGDYSIKIWPQPSGGAFLMTVCSTCNQDAETGKVYRTVDFRRALSLGIDREAMIDTLFVGVGVPGNWLPHPSVQYYPGDDYAFLETNYDPDLANSLLDGMGYTEKDSDGFRLRLDGSGERLSFPALSILDVTTDGAQLMIDYWAEIGLQFKSKAMKTPWTLTYPGKEPLLITHYQANYAANPWYALWTRCCGVGGGAGSFVPDINDLDRSMKRGPDGAVPMEGGYAPQCGCDMSSVWEPKAPADTYPADPLGKVKILHDSWHTGVGVPALSPERIELGKEIYRIHAEQKYHISVVSHNGMFRGIILHQNNVNNVPGTHTNDNNGFYNELYYFDNGEDNIR